MQIPDTFNKYFVELGEKLANKISQWNILPDSFFSDVHHPTNGLPSFQEISENVVLKLLHVLGPKPNVWCENLNFRFFSATKN